MLFARSSIACLPLPPSVSTLVSEQMASSALHGISYPYLIFLRVALFARTARLRDLAAPYGGPEYMDPLQRALDRGSKALELINSPLVMDYIHVKFSCTLPKWTSSSTIPRTINPGFYKYHDFDEYDFRDVLESCDDQENKLKTTERWDDILLRSGACERGVNPRR